MTMDSIDDVVEDKVEAIVEESTDDSSGDTTVVVVDAEPAAAPAEAAAEALSLANEVTFIAQKEAQDAASDAVLTTLAVAEERYLTREEALQMVTEATAAAVAAIVNAQNQPTMMEEIIEEDEVPDRYERHPWYKRRFGGQ